jgi:hypothetical protein
MPRDCRGIKKIERQQRAATKRAERRQRKRERQRSIATVESILEQNRTSGPSNGRPAV